MLTLGSQIRIHRQLLVVIFMFFLFCLFPDYPAKRFIVGLIVFSFSQLLASNDEPDMLEAVGVVEYNAIIRKKMRRYG